MFTHKTFDLPSMLAGLVVGIIGFIWFIKQSDRSGDGGCFYTLLISIVIAIATIMCVAMDGL